MGPRSTGVGALSLMHFSAGARGCRRAWPLPQSPTGLDPGGGWARDKFAEAAIGALVRARARACVCWGGMRMHEYLESHPRIQQHITRARSHPGHTCGGGGALRPRSRPPAPPPRRPPPTARRYWGVRRGEEGEGPPPRLRPPPQLGAGKTPAPLPRPRQASPRAPPGAPSA